MTWTYTSTDLTADRDKVRTYIGDTDPSDQLLSDEQIAFALTEAGPVRSASALACEWIAAKFARQADKSVGDMSITYSQKAAQYTDLAQRLRREATVLALPYFGGISQSAKDTREADTDRVKPAFTTTMLDDPQLSSATDDDSDADVS